MKSFIKIYVLFLLCFWCCFIAKSQPLPDSLRTLYNHAKTDADKGKVLNKYLGLFNDDPLNTKKIKELSIYFEDHKDQVGQDYVQLTGIYNISQSGDYITALDQSLEVLSRFEKRKDNYGMMYAYLQVALAFINSGDLNQSKFYCQKITSLAEPVLDRTVLSAAYNMIGSNITGLGKLNSAFFYIDKAVRYATEANDSINLTFAVGTLGEYYIARKDYNSAIPLIKRSIQIGEAINIDNAIGFGLNDLAQIFLEKEQADSCIYYARKALKFSEGRGFKNHVQRAYEYMYQAYENTNTKDSVYKYYRLANITKDSLYSTQKARQTQAIDFREQSRKQAAEQEKIQFKNTVRMYAMLAVIIIFILIAYLLYINNRNRQKANTILQQQKEVLQSTIAELKSTQAQLIQSEKMASLGELTAGIAHEIQNPLNFVNNFSDVNKELLTEMKDEIDKGNLDDAKEIANDVIANEEKINHHGKRADAIVKGMLQHSQSSSATKEPTDINKLADEYLRLSYHGLRAKDKSFNATIQTNFDATIGNMNIIPQDIGRVLLNLINNAFYAVNEKFKAEGLRPKTEGKTYEPTVSVNTKRIGDKVFVSVKDNGDGIPQKIVNKIFQPFFTTKPTGQGTGLGLSLAYDIIKAHGGELKVETKESEGSEFMIWLPSKKSLNAVV